MSKSKIKAAVVGANGYAGAEALRLLSAHPHVDVVAATSRTHAGKRVGEVFPSLPLDIEFTDTAAKELKGCDVVFTALPQTAGARLVGELIDGGARVVDLSADYRFDDTALYEKTYGVTHPRRELNDLAVYGLCEVNRENIRKAKLVANPGCYVTSALLPLIPLARKNLLNDVIIDSKSGTSGAGRKSDEAYSYCSVDENFKAYGVFTHRHAPEISEKLGLPVVFTPHLLPIKRGILSTVYFRTPDPTAAASILENAYAAERFVRYSDKLPEIAWAAHTNRCIYSAKFDGERGIIVSVIDNLLKGAAGQAVQNMNIMFGFDEAEGLPLCAPV